MERSPSNLGGCGRGHGHYRGRDCQLLTLSAISSHRRDRDHGRCRRRDHRSPAHARAHPCQRHTNPGCRDRLAPDPSELRSSRPPPLPAPSTGPHGGPERDSDPDCPPASVLVAQQPPVALLFRPPQGHLDPVLHPCQSRAAPGRWEGLAPDPSKMRASLPLDPSVLCSSRPPLLTTPSNGRGAHSGPGRDSDHGHPPASVLVSQPPPLALLLRPPEGHRGPLLHLCQSHAAPRCCERLAPAQSELRA